jgi:hypothetical protein
MARRRFHEEASLRPARAASRPFSLAASTAASLGRFFFFLFSCAPLAVGRPIDRASGGF